MRDKRRQREGKNKGNKGKEKTQKEDWRKIEKRKGKKKESKRGEKGRKGNAEVEMNNRPLDCAEHSYLLWQSQKSSSPSTTITTSPLSLGATRHVTGVTKEIVRA